MTPNQQPKSSERRATVLVVDDETMIRNVVGWVLRRRGYDVLEACDGRAGLESFERHDDIDLVLSDIMMPKLDGVGMVQALRKRRPDLRVLFMTGYAGSDRPAIDGEDLRRLLDKPFTRQQLVERIEQVLADAG